MKTKLEILFPLRKGTKPYIISIFLLLFLSLEVQSAPIQVQDVTGEVIHLAQTPQRLIPLMPSVAELLSDLLDGQLNKIVGVTEYTDYPPALKSHPKIGSYVQVNLEKVAALKPDLIIASMDGNLESQVKRLKGLGFQVLVVRTESLAQMKESISLISRAIGLPERGEKLISSVNAQLDEFKSRSSLKKIKSKVLLQVGDYPLVVVGSQSYLNDVLNTLGVQNIYSDVHQRYPKPSIEDVIQKNPDVIVVLALDPNNERIRKVKNHWSKFKNINAVKNEKVFVIHSDELLRPAMRLFSGMRELEKSLR